MKRVCQVLLLGGALGLPSALADGANWAVSRVNDALLTAPAGVTVREMSGVTYVGEFGGVHRFIAAEEDRGELVQFDVALSGAGAITAVSGVTAIDIAPTLDFEGIAFASADRHSVLLSEENAPGLHEVDLATGAITQSLETPGVFNSATLRANLGFESLARTADGKAIWTANEQALTVDGPTSTASAGTTVRLLRLNLDGDTTAAGPQYAYVTEPIHGSLTFGSPQSGLSDLVALPDGALLALERSVVVSTPVFLNRIYEIDLAGATDISGGALASGLSGQSFTPVAKHLLWSGAAAGANGQNMEGLALGPRLPGGDWVLIGVVDDDPTDNDTLSANTIVAFRLSANVSADFNADGHVDGRDFLRWQRGAGQNIGAAHADGDADRDGDVDDADLQRWQGSFNPAASRGDRDQAAGLKRVPEPATGTIAWAAAVAALAAARREAAQRAGEGNRTLA